MEIFRDRWLLVVDKPHGCPTQRTRADEDGLYELLTARYGRVGLHHRLDRPASGLVLFTLDPAADRPVAEAFRRHRVQRRYLAVLYGDVADAQWTLPVEGKPARTDVRRLGGASALTAAELALHTGRKHQIRVQAALAGVPVVGDRRYGGVAGRRWPRLALHAWRLALDHPITGERLDLRAPLPDDLRLLWAQAGDPEPDASRPEG